MNAGVWAWDVKVLGGGGALAVHAMSYHVSAGLSSSISKLDQAGMMYAHRWSTLGAAGIEKSVP